jgi:hypothetical protein
MSRRVWWRASVFGAVVGATVIAVSGQWTLENWETLPFALASIIILHPILDGPAETHDLWRSWRTYVGVMLIVAAELIVLANGGFAYRH